MPKPYAMQQKPQAHQRLLHYLQTKLNERLEANTYRQLPAVANGLIDFSSNDYLGFAADPVLQHLITEEVLKHPQQQHGSTGSRLLTGNSLYAQELEEKIATFHQAEAALLFNSGYTANYGLLSTLPYKGHTILYDELVHASILDGIFKSKATPVAFKHNDMQQLKTMLQSANGIKYVVVEAVYSMDGDEAPLQQLVELCDQYDAALIVDEAHTIGLYGANGEGLVQALQLEERVFARIHTYGKALGAHGAAITGPKLLIHFLINYCRPFIFSTALPVHALAAIRIAYEYLPQQKERIQHVFKLAETLQQQVQGGRYRLLPAKGPIQSLLVPGEQAVKDAAKTICGQGLDVRPIVKPTVPAGQERIRICLHAYNTTEQVVNLANIIRKL